MSQLIKGMDMPKGDQQYYINLFKTADGFWAYEYRFENNESKYKTRLLYSVTEIPTPHGRLIDANKLSISVLKAMNNGEDSVIGLIDKAPTIIEAEE